MKTSSTPARKIFSLVHMKLVTEISDYCLLIISIAGNSVGDMQVDICITDISFNNILVVR